MPLIILCKAGYGCYSGKKEIADYHKPWDGCEEIFPGAGIGISVCFNKLSVSGG